MSIHVRKEPGDVIRHSVSREDMILINRLSKAELTPDQVYTFALRLCDNEIDRDWERFDEEALTILSGLFVGKSGIFDHNWSAEGQTARLYKTEVCREGGTTGAGDGCRFLKGYAYMLRSEKNAPLIEEIEAGIKKEVSIGCSVTGKVCSVCGREHCSHQGGQTYDGKLCYFTLREPADAYEWSFVAVPAQRRAGVIKSFVHEPDSSLKRMLSAHPGCLRQLEALEKEAELGRAYMAGLRKELVRLAGLTDETLDLKIFSSAAEKMEEDELLEMTRAYRRRMDEIYPASPQLRPRSAAPCGDEDQAFLI
ncbi:MAG: hypothetical protein HDT14_05525 [Oscillibacter sp.]|nr:hypothetical protein [Oscillibacter sp.]